MSKNIWIGLIVIIALILAGWYFIQSQQPQPTAPATQVQPETTPATTSASPSETEEMKQKMKQKMKQNKTVVNITSTGFSPANITINVGDSVIWRNGDSANHNVNSAPHPSHTTYSPLNLGVIKPGESKSLTFPTVGTYKYHDHPNPSLTGSVTVE